MHFKLDINTFFKYDSASMLVNEMRSSLGFDLTDFFKNKFSKEVQLRRDLENKEKSVLVKVSLSIRY